MHNYKLIVEYDGSPYRGWQVQKNAKTVQGTLIAAAGSLFDAPVEIQGAGRTDAGVHALGQVAHLIARQDMAPAKVMNGLNQLLPSTIAVLSVQRVPLSFHARKDAQARVYAYVLSMRRSAFSKKFTWWLKERPDPEKTSQALQIFKGLHDFSSFSERDAENKSASTKVKIMDARLLAGPDAWVIQITGSHFLWKMVRRMVGMAVEAGMERFSPEDIVAMLHAPSRVPAQYTAPPSGLFLEKVLYNDHKASR